MTITITHDPDDYRDYIRDRDIMERTMSQSHPHDDHNHNGTPIPTTMHDMIAALEAASELGVHYQASLVLYWINRERTNVLGEVIRAIAMVERARAARAVTQPQTQG